MNKFYINKTNNCQGEKLDKRFSVKHIIEDDYFREILNHKIGIPESLPKVYTHSLIKEQSEI